MQTHFALPPGNAKFTSPCHGAMDMANVSFWGSRPVVLSSHKHLYKRAGCTDADFVVVVNKVGDGGRGVVLLASRKDVCLPVYSLESLEQMWVVELGAGGFMSCVAARYVGDDLLIAVGTENGYASVYCSVDGEMVPTLIRKLDAVDRGFCGYLSSRNDAVLALEISSKGHIVVAMAESVSLFDGEDDNLLHRWCVPETHKLGQRYRNVRGQKQWSMTIHESSSTYSVYACCCVADNFEFPLYEHGGGGPPTYESKRRLCPILLYQLSHPFTMHSRHFSHMEMRYLLKMSCSALSSDGSTLATGTLDGTVCVWDVETGILMYSLPCISAVLSVLFLRKEGSSASRYVLSIDKKGNLKLWDNGHYLRGVHTCWTKMSVVDHSSLCLAMWGEDGIRGTIARPAVSIVYLGSMFYLIRWQIVLLCELFIRGRAERRVKGDALTRLLCRILPDLYYQHDAFRCMLSFII